MSKDFQMNNCCYSFLVKEKEDARIDLFLTKQLPHLSRSFIQGLIQKKNILVNEQTKEQDYLVRKGDRVKMNIPSSSRLDISAEPIVLDILWEDSCLLVVNKPAGMLTHPSSFKQKGTLVNALLHYCPHLSSVGGILRQGIVHRLDKDTSGVMVIAKDDYIHLALAAQFRKRVTQKTYLALARGNPVRNKGMIEGKIGRSPTKGKKMCRGGILSRDAITRYEVLKRWEDWCLLKMHPLTGRTHQIRLHLQSINCFLVGDSLYGGKRWYDFPCRIERPMLHALILGFFHPRKEKWMELKAPLPSDMKEAIDCLVDSSCFIDKNNEL